MGRLHFEKLILLFLNALTHNAQIVLHLTEPHWEESALLVPKDIRFWTSDVSLFAKMELLTPQNNVMTTIMWIMMDAQQLVKSKMDINATLIAFLYAEMGLKLEMKNVMIVIETLEMVAQIHVELKGRILHQIFKQLQVLAQRKIQNLFILKSHQKMMRNLLIKL